MKVYLSGPMHGFPNYNRAAFDEARELWRAAGHTVFCPTAISLAIHPDREVLERRHLIQHDLVCIAHADALAMLKGWEQSVGATLEVAYAQFLGLTIYKADTVHVLRTIDPVRCPWFELSGWIRCEK